MTEHLILGNQVSVPGQYNARAFGAIPTEVQAGFDSTTALNTALARAVADGFELYIPAGTYKTTAGLVTSVTTTAVRIRGAGAKTIIQPTANTFDALTIGKGNTSGSGGYVRDLVIAGSSARPTNGKAAVKIDQLKMFEVRNVTVDNYDIGFDLVNSCTGTQFHACTTGTGVNVGINLRTAAQSGNDLSFYDMNLYGEIAAVHISGGGRGYNFYGGVFNANNNSGTTPNDLRACVILGKDYLTSATGNCTDIIFKGNNFKSFRYCWGVRAFGTATASLEGSTWNPDSGAAIGLLKMTTAAASKVNLEGQNVSGTWSGTVLVNIAGDTNEFAITETGSYYSATINGASVTGSGILVQSQVSKGQSIYRSGGLNVLQLGLILLRDNAGTLETSTNWGGAWSASGVSGTIPFANITGKPASVAGYGILDAALASDFNQSLKVTDSPTFSSLTTTAEQSLSTYQFNRFLGLFTPALTTANQKINITFPNNSLQGTIEVSVASGWNNANDAGIVTKRLTVSITSGGSIQYQQSKYDEVLGALGTNLAISDLTWDATASLWRIQIANLVTTVNSPRAIFVKVLTNNATYFTGFKGVALGSAYTTDTTVFPAPILTFRGKVNTDNTVLDDGSGNATFRTIISNVAVGTAPFTVTSTTKVANLNSDLLDGFTTAITPTPNAIPVYDGSSGLAAVNFTGRLNGINFTASGTAPTGTPAANDVWIDVSTPSTPVVKVYTGAVWASSSGGGGGSGTTTIAEVLSSLPTASSGNRGRIIQIAGAAGVAEVSSLVMTAPCTTAGNVTVTLDGVAKTVALLTSDNTTTLVATKIRAATYPGWATGGTGATVTFTNLVSDAKADVIYSAGSTGATANPSTTTQGVSSTPDILYVCAKLGNDTYDWVAVEGGIGSIGGSGDMTKSVYDTNNNGVVDKAAKWETPRTIQLTGSIAGTGTMDGSANVTITTTGGGGGGGSGDGSLNLKTDFGAVGNGVADDTTPLQNALNSGAKINVPPGTYLITASVDMTVSTSMLVGVNATIKCASGGHKVAVSNGRAITGIMFDGTGIRFPYNHTNNGNFLVQNNKFLNSGEAINAYVGFGTYPSNITIDNNLFDGCNYAFFGALQKSFITNNRMINSTSRNWSFYAGSENVISGNYIDGGVTGIHFMTFRSVTDKFAMNRNIITDNHVSNISEEGISFDFQGNNATDTGSIMNGTVTSVSGTQLIPNFSLSTHSNEYINAYVIFLSGALKGKPYKVDTMGSGGTAYINMVEYIGGAKSGDKFVIMVGQIGNIISNNVVRYCQTGIDLYGSSYESVVIGNRAEYCEGAGVRVLQLYGLTGNGYYGLSMNNVIEANNVTGCDIRVMQVTFGNSPIDVLPIGNKIVNNIVNDGAIYYNYQQDNTLCSGNILNGVVFPAARTGVIMSPSNVPFKATVTDAAVTTWGFSGLAYDLFTKADSATTLGSSSVGGAWTAVSGTWGISSNEAYCVSDANNNAAILPTVGTGDYIVSCDVKGQLLGASWREAQLMFRYIDSNNFLHIGCDSGGMRIDKRDGGVDSTLYTDNFSEDINPFADNTWFTIKVICLKNWLYVYMNGNLYIAYSMSQTDYVKFGASGIVGIRLDKGGSPSVAARWDKFIVENV